ncbi:MAG: FAD-dependent oxidoreductase, partial [Acidobacteriota bacterium]
RNAATGEKWRREVDGLFVAIGHIPNTAVFKGQIDLDADGYIVSHGGARTSVPGVFHAGDVADRTYRQAVTAAAAGCMAAIEAEHFLEAEGHSGKTVRRPCRFQPQATEPTHLEGRHPGTGFCYRV